MSLNNKTKQQIYFQWFHKTAKWNSFCRILQFCQLLWKNCPSDTPDQVWRFKMDFLFKKHPETSSSVVFVMRKGLSSYMIHTWHTFNCKHSSYFSWFDFFIFSSYTFVDFSLCFIFVLLLTLSSFTFKLISNQLNMTSESQKLNYDVK